MALGAERLQVMRMVLKQAAIVAGIGISAGLLLSLAARPALLTSLGRPRAGGPLSGFDPLLFGLVPLALLLIHSSLPRSRRGTHPESIRSGR